MGQTSSFEVHKVTINDYDKVLSIRDGDDIYGGTDNIPNSFHAIMSSPENEGFSAVIKGQFVSILFMIVLYVWYHQPLYLVSVNSVLLDSCYNMNYMNPTKYQGRCSGE